MVDFRRRGFRADRPVERARLEAAGAAFVAGFNQVVRDGVGGVHGALALHAPEHRGFAYEGAGMACGMLDLASAGRARCLRRLLDGPGEAYVHLVHVGAGWALVRLPWRAVRPLGAAGQLDPLLRWLALDGRGFARGFFGGARAVERAGGAGRHPDGCGPACGIGYQGLGRSLWFIEAAEVEAIADRIGTLPARHRGDAWSGVALAACYAGGLDRQGLERLLALSGTCRPDLAQGAAFAAEAWRRAGAVPDHAGLAIGAIAGAGPGEAARWTVQAAEGLDGPGATAASYQRWRARIRARATAAVAAPDHGRAS
jgi:hypothetical protein